MNQSRLPVQGATHQLVLSAILSVSVPRWRRRKRIEGHAHGAGLLRDSAVGDRCAFAIDTCSNKATICGPHARRRVLPGRRCAEVSRP